MHVPSYLRLTLKVICTIGPLWLIFAQLDLEEAVAQILGVEPIHLIGALLILFSLSVPSALRWGCVLKIVGFPLKFAKAWSVMLVSGFFSNGLPTSIGGDLIRMAQVFRIGISGDLAISNVVIDRLTSFVSLLFLVVMTFPNLFFLVDNTFPWWVIPLLVVVGITMFYLLTLFQYVPKQYWNSRYFQGLFYFSKYLLAVLSNRRWGWSAMVAGFVVHIMRVGAIWLLAMGLHIDVDFLDCLTLIPLALLVAMIPISIGGWGIREGAFLGAFSLVGVVPGDAVALSVTFGLSRIVASFPGGLIWIFNTDIRQSVNTDWHQKKEDSS